MNYRTQQDDPDTPRKMSIRTKVDRELRANLISIQDGAAPSDRWLNIRRGRVRPLGTVTRVLEDAHTAGLDRERVRAAVVQAVETAIELIYHDEPKRAA